MPVTALFPTWKQNSIKNARGKDVKHSKLFLVSGKIVTDQGMTVYWKKVKGQSQVPGPDKMGNDEADFLAKAGAVDGPLWEFREEWLPERQTCAVNAVTCHQARESHKNPDLQSQTLHLGRQPGNSDFAGQRPSDS